MASSRTPEASQGSHPRWRLRCDACGAGGAIGPRGAGHDGWCEACQRGQEVAAGTAAASCAHCGGPLSLESPGFLEAWGAAQELAAVLAAWRGDAAPLRALLPERPRFITDLTPPAAAPSDDAEAASALDALTRGAYSTARGSLEAWTARAPHETRAWEARAIAEERLGAPAAAEAFWTRALETHGDDGGPVAQRIRLARGALRARRADLDGAAEDFARAGTGREARWNRAARLVLDAVVRTPGLPAPELLETARAEAGEASSYWSDFTVGRLLWTLLVERAESRRRAGVPACPDERVLRAAEAEFEHDTFWDRAMVLAAYAALGMPGEAAAVAATLARGQAEALAVQPFLRAQGAAPMREAAEAALAAVRAGDPAAANAAIERLAAREDLRRYTVPCAACGRGRLAAEAIEDEPEE